MQSGGEMRLKWLVIGVVGWLGVATATSLLAVERAASAGALLQSVVRLEGLPQSVEISSQLQLLHALAELDLGMTAAAAERIARIKGTATVTETAEQLWLLAALRYWQQGEAELSRQALARLQGPLPEELARAQLLLQGLHHYRQGEPAAAIANFSKLRRESEFLSLEALDLAMVLLQAGESDYAIDLLRLLASSPAAGEREERLRDRANLVLARTLAARGLSDAAQAALHQVRLNGPDGSAALLLLGWVKLDLLGSEAALAPWMELSLRNENEPAVIEGRLALPMALAHRAPDQRALAQFDAAIAFYQQRLTQLDATLGELATAGDEPQWLARGAALRHGGSQQLAALVQAHEELLAAAGQWQVPDGAELYEPDALRSRLLLQLRDAANGLADSSRDAPWRAMYGTLHRYLAASFENDRVRSGRQALAEAPFDTEAALLSEAAAQLRQRYRSGLHAALQLQRQRVAGYLEQARYARAALHEQALLQPQEGV